jgi:hypothetical protein
MVPWNSHWGLENMKMKIAVLLILLIVCFVGGYRAAIVHAESGTTVVNVPKEFGTFKGISYAGLLLFEDSKGTVRGVDPNESGKVTLQIDRK